MSFKDILAQIVSRLVSAKDANAFCIDEKFYTYKQFAQIVSKIRKALQSLTIESRNTGIVANDDIETYAAIFALWMEGSAYVPLHPLQPNERNLEIIFQAEIQTVLSSGDVLTLPGNVKRIKTNQLVFDELFLDIRSSEQFDLAYILFTSGSTGKPKGVPITHRNLNAFVEAFQEGYTVTEKDRCLQPFDLTFDFSVASYLVPLLSGACVYTVPHNGIRYNYIAELLEEHSLTFAPMVPSILRYLRPYFNEINLPSLAYNFFCGEALPLDLIQEWSKCIPNAHIDNFYGPTEATVFFSRYRFNRNGKNKSYNDALCIGKPMNACKMMVVNENLQPIVAGQGENIEQGELCLAGEQITPGYWKNPKKNKEAFFVYNSERFYRTGDICYCDEEGDYLYCGRLDSQVKIQGFRIELGEIEHHAREFLEKYNAVCIAVESENGNGELVLFVEIAEGDSKELLAYLKTKLPLYMVPSKTVYCPQFPLNANGKTDKEKLTRMV